MRGIHEQGGLRNGVFTYYYANGKTERTGAFEMNEMSGDWNYYNSYGQLRLTIRCGPDGMFTPLFAVNRAGDTLLNNGNGSFILDTDDFDEWIYPSNAAIKLIEGHCANGLRDGIWKYYALNYQAKNGGLQQPVKELYGEEKYRSGTFKSGKLMSADNKAASYDTYKNILKAIPLKDLFSDQLKTDYAFGGGQ